MLPEEERECRNTQIIADVAQEKAKDCLSRFHVADLKFYRLERVQFNKGLKSRGLTVKRTEMK